MHQYVRYVSRYAHGRLAGTPSRVESVKTPNANCKRDQVGIAESGTYIHNIELVNRKERNILKRFRDFYCLFGMNKLIFSRGLLWTFGGSLES